MLQKLSRNASDVDTNIAVIFPYFFIYCYSDVRVHVRMRLRPGMSGFLVLAGRFERFQAFVLLLVCVVLR